ncbi:MAG: helix-turn-helix transcriptional regulator, partial [Nitrospira sp.]|nr:helix-turn-helix transcriptional regulator [Nitrospira sp.]
MEERKPLLNTSYVRNRFEQLELKQEWAAARIGVARKTVSRWLNGRVDRIERDNAARLAELLGCAVDDVCLDDPAQRLATPAEQREAARLIESRDLIARLSAS